MGVSDKQIDSLLFDLHNESSKDNDVVYVIKSILMLVESVNKLTDEVSELSKQVSRSNKLNKYSPPTKF
jgi:hypothetical protein